MEYRIFCRDSKLGHNFILLPSKNQYKSDIGKQIIRLVIISVEFVQLI